MQNDPSQKQPDKYKRITQAQFDLWLANPVTKTYLQCIEWSCEQISEILGKGLHIDASNNDLSMNRIQSLLGQKIGLKNAHSLWSIMITHEMIELPKE